MVLLHIGAGASFLVFGLPWAGRLLRGCSTAEKAGWIVFLLGGTAGGVILSPARRGMWPVLYTHELVSALASAILLSAWAGSRGCLCAAAWQQAVRIGGSLALVTAAAAGAR